VNGTVLLNCFFYSSFSIFLKIGLFKNILDDVVVICRWLKAKTLRDGGGGGVGTEKADCLFLFALGNVSCIWVEMHQILFKYFIKNEWYLFLTAFYCFPR